MIISHKQPKNFAITFLSSIVLCCILVSCSSKEVSTTLENSGLSNAETPAAPKSTAVTSPTATENMMLATKPSPQSMDDDYEKVDAVFTVKENTSPPPVNVLKQLKYSAGFGGASGICGYEEGQQTSTLYWSRGGPRDPNNEYKEGDELTLEWMDQISLALCGIKPDEPVKLLVKYQSGNIFYEKDLIASAGWSSDIYGEVYDRLYIPMGTEPGIYKINITGEGWEIIRKYNLRLPDSPRVYNIGTSNDDKRLFLYNFTPNENVTLLVYENSMRSNYDDPNVKELVGWQGFIVDEKGQLTIKVEFQSYNDQSYIVIGEKSGEISVTPIVRHAFDNHKVTIPEYGVDLFIPTTDENEQMKNILTIAGYKDPTSPTTIEYQANITSNQLISWVYMWCANDNEKLIAAKDIFSLEYLIQDFKIDMAIISERPTTNNSGWYCLPYKAYLRGWEAGKEYTLEMRYTLSEDWSDGKNIYKAGTYRHIIMVNVGNN